MFGIGLDLKIGSLREDFLRLDVTRLCNSFSSAERRLIILNPDSLFEAEVSSGIAGTCKPTVVFVLSCCSSFLRLLTYFCVACLVQLARNPKNHVYLLSEHDRHTVDGWFNSFADHKIYLTAEHGYASVLGD